MQLKLLSIASEKVRKTLNFPTLESQLLLFVDYSNFNIPRGSAFNFYKINENDLWVNCEIVLEYITQEWGKEYLNIPKGHKTICNFSGIDTIPCLQLLPEADAWKLSDNYLIIANS